MRAKAQEELKKLSSALELEQLEIKYLGRKGELARMMKGLSEVAATERPKFGALANEVKLELEQAFARLKQELGGGDKATPSIDVTLPGIKPVRGHMHPVMQVQRELEELFRSMGFMVLDGPELESEYYNFESLNIPSWHPARDIQDTFYVHPPKFAGKDGRVKGGTPENRWLLRTHTSAMQVRALTKYGAPLRAVVPGRVFRYEATDASHEHTFWQMEGLVVDKDISISHLIATMKALLAGIFRTVVEVRLRPGYFPFVEPGFELDIKCLV
ncbi:MAG: phenylalanine--tRNA ligase subunit alpha, partial [Candidatus Kerfeldbacteria bacterium]|nr:phenylalanine--tRNA ligase subunit alpha [Candidatus Kerfeldbacteria bacterium]